MSDLDKNKLIESINVLIIKRKKIIKTSGNDEIRKNAREQIKILAFILKYIRMNDFSLGLEFCSRLEFCSVEE